MIEPCYDWTPVGYTRNPIPGDPDVVTSTASVFARTSQHLSSAARALRRLDSGDTVSEAVAKLRDNAREIADLLEQANVRYESASSALTAYAPQLAKAKHDAEQALHAATTAKSDHERAHHNAVTLWWGAKTTLDPQERSEYLQAYYRAKAQADQAEGNVNSARAQVEEAIALRDQAATAAQQTINSSIANAEINDGLFDHLKELWDDVVELGEAMLDSIPGLRALVDGLAAIGKWIWDHIEEISLVLTVLSLVAGWIPVAGWVLTALAVAARVAALISKAKLIISFVSSAAKGARTGDWSDLAKVGASYIIGKGVGKVLGKAYKSFAGRVSSKSWSIVRDESVRVTGNLNKVAIALEKSGAKQMSVGQRLVHYFAGNNPLAPVTDAGRNVDKLTSLFKDSAISAKASDASAISHLIDNKSTERLVEHEIKEALAPAKDAVVDYVGHRFTKQDCPAGAGVAA